MLKLNFITEERPFIDQRIFEYSRLNLENIEEELDQIDENAPFYSSDKIRNIKQQIQSLKNEINRVSIRNDEYVNFIKMLDKHLLFWDCFRLINKNKTESTLRVERILLGFSQNKLSIYPTSMI